LYYVLQQIWLFIKSYYRHLVTIIALYSMIIGLINWTNTVEWPFILFLVGYVAGVAIWHIPSRHTNFRGVVTTLSTAVFLLGIVYFFNNIRTDPSNFFTVPFLMSYVLSGAGFVLPVILWHVELKSSVILIIQAIVGIFQGIWNALKQTFWAVIGLIRTNYREIVTTFSLSCMFIGSLGIGLVVIDSHFNLLPLGLFFLGYLVNYFIWRFPNRHARFRGITTTLSIFIVIWGTLLLFSNIRPTSNLFEVPFLFTFLLIGVGSVIPIYLWLEELLQLLKQTAEAVAKVFKRTILTIIDFMKTVWNAIKQTFWVAAEFVRKNYKELVSGFSVICMFLGFVGSYRFFDVVSLGLFFLGYLVCCSIWRFPDRHEYFRGITTIISSLIVFWGVFLLFLKLGPSSDVFAVPFLITYLFIGVGGVLPTYLWRVELWQLMKQIIEAIVHIFRRTVLSVINLMRAVWAAIKQTFWGIINSVYRVLQFSYQSLIKLSHYVHSNFWRIMRYLSSLVGFLMINLGLYTLIVTNFDPIGILWILAGFLIICGAWWENSLQILGMIGYSLKKTIVAVKKYTFQFGAYLRVQTLALLEFSRVYFDPIVKITAIILGSLLNFFGLLYYIGAPSEPLFPLSLIGLGILILYIPWRTEINNLFRVTGVAIRKAIIAFVIYVRSLWKEILRAGCTFLGGFSVVFGLYTWNILPIGVGLGILFITWFIQIRDASKVFGYFIWGMGVGIKNLIVNTIQIVKGFFQTYYGLLSRYLVCFFGLIFIFLSFPSEISEINEFLPFILIMVGYFSSIFAWYRHSYFRGIGTVLSMLITLVGLY
ncbi:MAG: hypothetical protein ACXACP_12675, partial [Candidatus Hodarchaeales archaeon]